MESAMASLYMSGDTVTSIRIGGTFLPADKDRMKRQHAGIIHLLVVHGRYTRRAFLQGPPPRYVSKGAKPPA